jgi:hypothetical protein
MSLPLSGSANELDSEFSFMTLNGLLSLAIQVDGVPRDFERYGLAAETISQQTATALRDNGIKVLKFDAAKKEPQAGLMKIKLTAHENQYRFYNYGVSIEVKQKIPLNNPAGGFISGTVWKKGSTGVVLPTELRKMNSIIGELVAQFLSDHRAQNRSRVSAAN